MLGNYSNKDPCHMQVRSLVKWWIINKTDINAHIGKSGFFQVAHSIKHSNMECGVHLPYLMTKLKRDENLVGLIWASKVSYQKALKMFGIAKIRQDLHLKRSVKRRSFDLCITMNWRWFMAGKFHHIEFSFQICIAL